MKKSKSASMLPQLDKEKSTNEDEQNVGKSDDPENVQTEQITIKRRDIHSMRVTLNQCDD